MSEDNGFDLYGDVLDTTDNNTNSTHHHHHHSYSQQHQQLSDPRLAPSLNHQHPSSTSFHSSVVVPSNIIIQQQQQQQQQASTVAKAVVTDNFIEEDNNNMLIDVVPGLITRRQTPFQQAPMNWLLQHSSSSSTMDHDATVYVSISGLHWYTTDAYMENLLGQYGKVVRCDFLEEKTNGKSKGYVFVVLLQYCSLH